MKWLGNFIMTRRSEHLVSRLRNYLPQKGTIADIGSGTGHNAAAIRRSVGLRVREFDVVDLHWVGPGPELMGDSNIPDNGQFFDGLIMLFVLQYPKSPEELLRECRRVSRGPLLIVQSTYQSRSGRIVLAIREFFWGRFALRLARLTGLVHHVQCSLEPCHAFTRSELIDLFSRVGLGVVEMIPAEWWMMGVSRDLFVLRSEGY